MEGSFAYPKLPLVALTTCCLLLSDLNTQNAQDQAPKMKQWMDGQKAFFRCSSSENLE